MKRVSYREAVSFIALNDSPASSDSADELLGYVTVVLVSEIFGVDQEKVARDVFKKRNNVNLGGGRMSNKLHERSLEILMVIRERTIDTDRGGMWTKSNSSGLSDWCADLDRHVNISDYYPDGDVTRLKGLVSRGLVERIKSSTSNSVFYKITEEGSLTIELARQAGQWPKCGSR